MIWDDDPCVGLVATKHHVAAGLATKGKPRAFQSAADFLAG